MNSEKNTIVQKCLSQEQFKTFHCQFMIQLRFIIFKHQYNGEVLLCGHVIIFFILSVVRKRYKTHKGVGLPKTLVAYCQVMPPVSNQQGFDCCDPCYKVVGDPIGHWWHILTTSLRQPNLFTSFYGKGKKLAKFFYVTKSNRYKSFLCYLCTQPMVKHNLTMFYTMYVYI